MSIPSLNSHFLHIEAVEWSDWSYTWHILGVQVATSTDGNLI